ncbi:MAG: hypothetical protein K2P85_04230 [Flavobacteriaceae bacterium]|nr:hypothetical protein [Flavobacteriaceae bacterium]
MKLQKEVVDYILDLPEQDYFPKRNYSNYIETVKKRIESSSIVLKTQSDNSVNHSDFTEYYRKIEEGNYNEFYFEGYKWYSTFFTVQVSIDNEFYINWTSLKENIEIEKIKTFNSDNEEKIENISSFSTYLDIDENNIKEENKLEKSAENKSVTNIFNGPTNIGNFGDYGKIDEFKVVNDESPKVKSNSGLATDELLEVKKWKKTSKLILILSILVTFLLMISYIQEFKFIMSNENWIIFKDSSLNKLVSVILLFLWNAFLSKIYYDRNFDPSKENAFIDLYRKRKKN